VLEVYLLQHSLLPAGCREAANCQY